MAIKDILLPLISYPHATESLDQCGGLRCIALLTCGKREPHRTSQAANGHMYLGAQATARAAERLIFRPPFFAPAAC